MVRFSALAFAAGCLCGTTVFAQAYPYGVCAHLTRSERSEHLLRGTLDSMGLAGIRYVRSDFDYGAMRGKDGGWDFTDYDNLLSELEARGVTLLPILYGKESPPADMASYGDYIRTVVRHFGKRLPVVEIWNEPNLNGFFPGTDPVMYAKTLKAAYEAVKSVDPSIRVAYGGTADVAVEWIRKTFDAGALNSFDIMCVHPYTMPAKPEGRMDIKTEKLHKLMAEYGVADRPIWFTEIGWPTHSLVANMTHVSAILLPGLKVARPEQKSWKMIMIDSRVAGPKPDQAVARDLEDLLPAGSEVIACTQSEANRRLADGGVDAVVYPFDESFPSETIDSVNEFIRKGGVLIDMGGVPCAYGFRDNEHVKSMANGAALGRFPFGYRAWWLGKKGTYPPSCQVFATERGLAAGVKQEPTGFKADRYLVPDRAGKDSEWIPLVAGKGTNGVDLVAAAVIRYHGERQGAAILCSLATQSGAHGTNDEESQAKFTARGLALAFAEGVEAYFTYSLRSFETDPYHSEDHFGLTHADFQPKPAYSAYANFTRERPAGSVNASGAWHNADRTVFFPQWKRPDGKRGGMIWRLGEPVRRALQFTGGEPQFRNMYGRKINVRKTAAGEYLLDMSDSPVYFSGATLVSAGN